MTIGEQLNKSADAMDALLIYANGVTGNADTNIGDAIKTLCDSYAPQPEFLEYVHSEIHVDSFETYDTFTDFKTVYLPFDSQKYFACIAEFLFLNNGNVNRAGKYAINSTVYDAINNSTGFYSVTHGYRVGHDDGGDTWGLDIHAGATVISNICYVKNRFNM